MSDDIMESLRHNLQKLKTKPERVEVSRAEAFLLADAAWRTTMIPTTATREDIFESVVAGEFKFMGAPVVVVPEKDDK